MLEGGACDEVVGGNKKGDDLISHLLFMWIVILD